MSAQQDFSKLGYVGSLGQTVDRNDWYTPAKYIEAARAVLGEIDFDPYSDAVANQTVKATRIRTKGNNGSVWCVDPHCIKTVFMNPPYSRGMVEKAVNEFIGEYQRLKFDGIVLVNNATETKWFQFLLNSADALCLTDHRIAFNQADGKAVSGNTRGQAFFYFGGQSKFAGQCRFRQVFEQFGFTVKL